MLTSIFLLALSVSIDSLGIGITYGLKNTKITNIAKCILFIISLLITTLSLSIGDFIAVLFPPFVASLLGSILLIGMGIWVLWQSFTKKEAMQPTTSTLSINLEPTIHEFFIKSLGITIQIIRNPLTSDLDNSQKIDAREAIYLGFALSIDSLCVGIGSSILGFNTFLFPILVATFQLIFLSMGSRLGKFLQKVSPIPNCIWNILSGIILIGIGISRLFL